MRNIAPLMIAAALTISAPAAAQNANDTTAANSTTVNDATMAPESGNTVGTGDAVADAPVNGLTAGPGAAPETLPPAAVDTTTEGVPADDNDGGGFPWGVLGLLGLVGLIPRKSRS